MSDYTITVIGTGVIGTSIGLALKQTSDPPRLIAHDKNLGNAQAAVKAGAFDRSEWNLINACDPADMIVLAIPTPGIRPTLEAIAEEVKQGAIITDTSPDKAVTLQWAAESLPSHVHFIGGNPLVHPRGTGHKHATADLFKNRLYCLSPAASANEQAVQVLTGWVNLLGAEPFFVDAAEHDGLLAATTHLPALTSIALFQTMASQTSWREARKLAGPLFEQATAGAATNAESLSSSLHANRETLRQWLSVYVAQLRELQTLIEGDERALQEFLEPLVDERDKWVHDYTKGDFLDPELTPAKMETPGLFKRFMGLGR